MLLSGAGGTASAQGAAGAIASAALAPGQRFDPANVREAARALARKPYAAPPNDLPDALSNLNYEQYVAIRGLPEGLVWGGEGRGFVVEPLHRGFVFTNAVALHVVAGGVIQRLAYERARFDFDGVKVPPNLPDIGFSGVKLYSTAWSQQPTEFAIVQGATFFRALARGQNLGVVARALTLKPAESRGEEIPVFRGFWLERPTTGANTLVMHGLVDSESVAGAVRMTLRPGEVTIVDVESTLFPRVALDHVGLGGMTATYLFGPSSRRMAEDVRPAAYEISGLQILNGQGEWLWRPCNNPESLQISAFLDRNPRGFGLVQRTRDYMSFQDDDQRWERRPSLWVEPIGEWGQGAVQLIEIPSESEVNDNIIAYWRPRAPVPAGSEFSFSYRQFWSWSPPERPALATVANLRVGRGAGGRRRRFLIDFTGDALGEPVPDLRPALSASPGSIRGLRIFAYPERKALRVAFDLDPGNENACEMRLVLEAAGKPISETWLYRWTP